MLPKPACIREVEPLVHTGQEIIEALHLEVGAWLDFPVLAVTVSLTPFPLLMVQRLHFPRLVVAHLGVVTLLQWGLSEFLG